MHTLLDSRGVQSKVNADAVISTEGSAHKKASPCITPGGSENNKQQDIFLIGMFH
jgi:hypothetical protein